MTMVYSPLGANFAATSTDAKFKVGTRGYGDDNTEWVYVKASEAISAYNFVAFDEDYAAAQITTTNANADWTVGVAQVAIASGSYGWVCVKGSNVLGLGMTGATADAVLYTQTAAATLGSGLTSAGAKIDGVVFVTSPSTSAGVNVECILAYPRASTL